MIGGHGRDRAGRPSTRATGGWSTCACRPARPYGRTDLAGRLDAARATLADPTVHIVVAGEFKQGKSSLVNALLGATVCPVDDDVATAVPTYVRHGDEPRADAPARRPTVIRRAREPIELDDVRAHVVEEGRPDRGAPERDRSGWRSRLPRKLLAGGLVLVDTPGVGGLGLGPRGRPAWPRSPWPTRSSSSPTPRRS